MRQLSFMLSIVCVVCQVAWSTSEVAAQITLSVDEVQLFSSNNAQSHTFDVILTHSLPDPLELTGFQAEFSIVGLEAGLPNASFTNTSGPQTRPYVLSPNSSAPVSQIVNSGETLQVGDFLLTNFALADSGSALASVTFEIDGGVDLGDSYGITFDTDPDTSFLVDRDGNSLTIDAVDGSFVATSVPEPGSTPIIAMFFVFALSTHRRRGSSPTLILAKG